MKRIIAWYKKRRLRKMLKTTVRILGAVEQMMKQAGYSRQKRREVWRNFSKFNGRKDIIKLLERSLWD